MATNRREKVEGPFWIGIGVIICLLGWKAKLGTFHEPGPGFAAFLTGLFVAVIGMAIALLEAFSKISRSAAFDLGSAFENISWFRIAYTMALLLGYALFLDKLGYILTTFFVMWGLFCDRKMDRWRSSFFISLGTTGASYLIFEVWLHCQFPRGILPWW
jgi:hypothetical protein